MPIEALKRAFGEFLTPNWSPTYMEDQKIPLWVSLFNCQIHPQDWCIPVESVWRRAGWKPPSKECPETMAKQQSFRTWIVTLPAGESQSIPQLPAQESHHG